MSSELFYGFDGQERLDNGIEETLERFIDELLWYTEALKAARIKGVPY